MTTVDDDLMLLWQQGTSSAPDASEVARLAARASMRRFDRLVARRNVIETTTAIALLAWFGWRVAAGDDRLVGGVSFACVSFVIIYLWWRHRHAIVVDATSSAQAYHAALLARVDQQIALLRTVPYWYLLPLYVPVALQAAALWPTSAAASIGLLIFAAAFYVALGVLNVRIAGARLRAERARIAALYQE